MATLQTLAADQAKAFADVQAAISRLQASIEALQKTSLTPEQQALIDKMDDDANTLDAAVSKVDLPPVTTTPAPTTPLPPTA